MTTQKTELLLTAVEEMIKLNLGTSELVVKGEMDESIMIMYLLGVRDDLEKLRNELKTQITLDNYRF